MFQEDCKSIDNFKTRVKGLGEGARERERERGALLWDCKELQSYQDFGWSVRSTKGIVF